MKRRMEKYTNRLIEDHFYRSTIMIEISVEDRSWDLGILFNYAIRLVLFGYQRIKC